MFRMFNKDQPRVVTQKPWSYGINQAQPQKTAIMQQLQGSDCLKKLQLTRSVGDFAAFSMVHEFSWR